MSEYYKTSNITGKRYNLFGIVRVLNLYQVKAYIEHGADVKHIEISEDYKTKKPVVVFYFDIEETKDLYDKWCKHELV